MKSSFYILLILISISCFAHVSEWEDDLQYRIEENQPRKNRKVASEEIQPSNEKIIVTIEEDQDRDIASSKNDSNTVQYWEYELESE